MKSNGIEHNRSAPYHPATNGEAERFVQSFKNALKASQKEPGTLVQKLSQFLFRYRITPHTTTGVPPTELFLKRVVRSRLDLLKLSVRDHVTQQQWGQKLCHDRTSKPREFVVGETVLAQNFQQGPKWIPGTITQRVGPVTYRVLVQGKERKYHVDQLRSEPGERREKDTNRELEDFGPEHQRPNMPDADEREPEPGANAGEIEAEDQSDHGSPTPTQRADAGNTGVEDQSEQGAPTPVRRYPERDRRPRSWYEPTF